jgi:hypothetical protein
MSGGYGYPQSGAQVAVPRMIAAALLVVAAALVFGGSFGAFSIFRFESPYTPASTTTTTAWGSVREPPSEDIPAGVTILHGIPLSVGAVLALAAAVLLMLSARRPDDPALGRLLGACAGGMLTGVVAVIWLVISASVANVAANAVADSEFRSSYEIGVGAYLILVGAVVALVASVLLLLPRRRPGPGPVPPYGPGQPQWPGAPQPWPPPGSAVPPPGWGPPPQHS